MIAFFDSGFGGLSIFSSVEQILPQYDYLYLGDTLRTPYGGRSPQAITAFTRQAVHYLRAQGATLIIVACHTASNLALRTLQHEFADDIRKNNWNILGVTIPLAEAAVEQTKNNRIGVLATRATVTSGNFTTEIHKLSPQTQVFAEAAPLLVPLIEEGWLTAPETKRILRRYLHPLKTSQIDTLILGCTHYPLIHSLISAKAGHRIHTLHSGDIIAAKLKDYLHRHPEITKKLTQKSTRRFLTTDCPAKFQTLGTLFRAKPLETVTQITL